MAEGDTKFKLRNIYEITNYCLEERCFQVLNYIKLQDINQKESRVSKVIKKKGDKLYVKWKGCNNWFNSLIDKKDITIQKRLLSRTNQLWQKQNKSRIRFF